MSSHRAIKGSSLVLIQQEAAGGGRASGRSGERASGQASKEEEAVVGRNLKASHLGGGGEGRGSWTAVDVHVGFLEEDERERERERGECWDGPAMTSSPVSE